MTVVDIMPTVLPMEDPDVSRVIQMSLKKHGVDVMCGVKIENITEGDKGGLKRFLTQAGNLTLRRPYCQ